MQPPFVDRWRTAVLAVVAAVVVPVGSAAAQPRCSGGCEASSARPLSWCRYSDGAGTVRTASNVSPAGLAAGLVEACFAYAKAHSDAAHRDRFVSCEPVVSLTLANSGSRWAAFGVEGEYLKVRYADGAIVEHNAGGWSLALCGCHDALEPRHAKVGVDARCYCPTGMQWNAGLQACEPGGPQIRSDSAK